MMGLMITTFVVLTGAAKGNEESNAPTRQTMQPGGAARKTLTSQETPMKNVPQIHETVKQHDARMQWFRDAKFGMFIHWGPCSVGQKEIGWGREANRPWDINQHGPRTPMPMHATSTG